MPINYHNKHNVLLDIDEYFVGSIIIQLDTYVHSTKAEYCNNEFSFICPRFVCHNFPVPM